jgi:hypothetical protein
MIGPGNRRNVHLAILLCGDSIVAACGHDRGSVEMCVAEVHGSPFRSPDRAHGERVGPCVQYVYLFS